MRQQVLLRRPHHAQEIAHDLDGLQGQRHDVGWHVLRPLAGLTHFVLELLDDLRRDDPQTPIEVELLRFGQPQLARAHPRQEQQPDAKLGLPAPGVVEPELLKELGQLGQVEIGVVGNRRLGLGHHVQVRGRVDFQPLGDHQGVAEQLVEPGADLLGDGERLALLDRRHDAHELGAANVVDRHLPQGGQNVLVENAQDLRERALAALLEFLAAMLDPGIKDVLEGVFACQPGRVPTLITFDLGINPPGEQGLGLVPLSAGLAQAEGGVATQGHALLLTQPVVAEHPRLAACG
ncbi:hypothetical protein SDC9_94897 [bioreactor metagenome]|uniref:Uncharacterized protein n=1 Tax=bioreactor metagenome TaxID=1076179 RepID=A0A645ABG5_9ZZZZ